MTGDTNISLPEDVLKITNGKRLEDIAVHVNYINWKGQFSLRKIIPLSMRYGSTEYHPEQQWLLHVWDVEKRGYRDYSLKDIREWIRVP